MHEHLWGVCCSFFFGGGSCFFQIYILFIRNNTRTRPLKLAKNDGFDRFRPSVVCDV